MTFCEARRIEKLFRRYRQLVVEYWKLVDPTNAPWTGESGTQLFRDTAASKALREQITRLLPEVEHSAARIGGRVTVATYPAPGLKEPMIPFNPLGGTVDLCTPHNYVEPQRVLDAIDRCIGAAEFVKRSILARMLKPWCWLIDVPALIVSWPFAVMRQAGVPDKIVESTGAQVVKAILTALLWLIGFAYAAYRTGLAAALDGVLGG